VVNTNAGATGSGLGTYILSLLEDHFPEVYRFTTAIFPSEDDDVITSPYNSVLSLRELTEHADCVLPIENEALIEICSRMPQLPNGASGPSVAVVDGSRLNDGIDLRALEHLYKSGKAAPSAAMGAVKKKRHAVASTKAHTATTTSQRQATSAFGEMNNIVARLLTNLTSSMRFEGSLNVDLNEITTNLVPYPKLHFLQSSMSPMFTTVDPRQQPRRLTQMFSDAFHRYVMCVILFLFRRRG
jgi:tubulin epsilon